MPFWLARRAAPHLWKRVPWKLVWAASIWLAEKGRERVEQNLNKHDRTEFLNLMMKSKGRPGNLTQRDRTRLKNIAGKAIRG
ncbi:MAG TPA: hypothetical protein VKA35_01590 [Solirubrobacterales bacterium]|nr:hypothetical protein [Solirubrobacterales bacterium]